MAELDEIEQAIVECAMRIAKQATTEKWLGKKLWTDSLISALCALGKDQGYYVCGKRGIEHGGQGEWLFDVVWLRNEREYVVDVPLILESEWLSDSKNIGEDFEKLLLGRARHRVMIFQHNHVEVVCDRLVEEVRQFGLTQAGDRYLFLGLDTVQTIFKPRLFVA